MCTYESLARSASELGLHKSSQLSSGVPGFLVGFSVKTLCTFASSA
jgi:hypothetical protein